MVKSSDGESSTEQAFSDHSGDSSPTGEISWKPFLPRLQQVSINLTQLQDPKLSQDPKKLQDPIYSQDQRHLQDSEKLQGSKNSHDRKYAKRKPCLCNQCAERFLNNGNLKRHIENQHKVALVEPLDEIQEAENDAQEAENDAHEADIDTQVADNDDISTEYKHTKIKDADINNLNPFEDLREADNGVKRTKRIYNKDANKGFRCKDCGRMFLYRSKYMTHLVKHSTEKRFLCPGCGGRFKTKYSMENHMTKLCLKADDRSKGKTNRIEFPCSECEKSFVRKSDYEAHFRKHSGERPFLCVYCGDRFKRKFNLKLHVAARHGILENGQPSAILKTKPTWKQSHTPKFSCSECSKLFHFQSELEAHMRKHTGECPYQCITCGFYFKRNSYLKRHMKTCTGKGKRSYREKRSIP